MTSSGSTSSAPGLASPVREISALRRSDIAFAGGKGANLGEMTAAGLPVPPGFDAVSERAQALVAGTAVPEDLAAAIRAAPGLVPRGHDP